MSTSGRREAPFGTWDLGRSTQSDTAGRPIPGRAPDPARRLGSHNLRCVPAKYGSGAVVFVGTAYAESSVPLPRGPFPSTVNSDSRAVE